MFITQEMIEKTAALSELNIESTDREVVADALNELLEYIDMLREVDTESIEPMFNVHDDVNVFRKDYVYECDCAKDIVKQSPCKDKYVVPRTIESEESGK